MIVSALQTTRQPTAGTAESSWGIDGIKECDGGCDVRTWFSSRAWEGLVSSHTLNLLAGQKSEGGSV